MRKVVETMKMKRVAGQVKVVFAGLLLLAIVVLVILQWPMGASCWLYGIERQTSTLWVVLVSGVLTLITIWLVKVLMTGLGAVRQTRESVRLEKLEKRVAEQKAPGEPGEE
jgi:hypothetical protein